MEDETPPTTHRERKDLQARFVPNIQKMFEEAAAAKKKPFFHSFLSWHSSFFDSCEKLHTFCESRFTECVKAEGSRKRDAWAELPGVCVDSLTDFSRTFRGDRGSVPPGRAAAGHQKVLAAEESCGLVAQTVKHVCRRWMRRPATPKNLGFSGRRLGGKSHAWLFPTDS